MSTATAPDVAASPAPPPAATGDPRWVRPALLALLGATAVTYLWNLGASGWANSFYAAAVQAGTQSPKAWLFGALDAPGLITVDKPPASLWVMALSGRIFGFSSWSMLVPQALMGVASVGLLYLVVRRWSGPRTALAAGALLAATPVAVLMFRFNNPDAMLVLTMVAATYTTTRAIDAAGRRAGTWWLVATGALVGLGFLTKQLQVLLVVPALALAVLVGAPSRLRRRIGDLLAGGAAMIVSAGWYVALVELWPASSRPYIGGSTTNSLLELALGYNGLGRILGDEGGGRGGPGGGGTPGGMPAGGPPGGMAGPGGMGGGPGGGGFGGSPGVQRLFTSEFSGQASWLLPAALVLLVAALWLLRRAPRTDRTRALLILGGTWTLVHAVVFSAMSGIIHPYYAVALAPGIALTTAVGASVLWRRRDALGARIVLAVVVAGTAAWSAVILTQHDWLPWARWVLLVAGIVGTVAVLAPAVRWGRAATVAGVVAALVAVLGGSTAFAAQTAATPHQGSIVGAGPGGGMGGPGGMPGDRRDGGDRARAGGMGGPEGETPSPQVVALLQSAGTRWAAATTGAQSAASLQLASGVPVMAMGGFMGSDPAPTLAEFQAAIASGQVRYYVEGGGPGGGTTRDDLPRNGGPGARGTSGEIRTWIEGNFTPIDVGGRTVYDLSASRP
ncbi:4-amino-4-deoxy-L-arabinose transferase-like glycosyltransferase [Actinomycetospora succinea]|uniref:4-amino-4-deoxy-L-arabinose transferase-like glycosyltransferase n=1 Tax=Actinomycetospora succinea TaxID=663603 RepID=A0A4R6VT42_9PSEU|nr:glycosyltransferase family 39 protein [Actinomycetospora succinea]TDQ63110.1 4-amino-4-deoxy-L-arabinose transferase-like glycosyltransferase [Actinomycetospora succinea]